MAVRRRWLAWSVAGALAAIVLAYATAVGYMMANEVALVFAPNGRDYAIAPEIARRIERVPRTVDGSPGLLWVLRGEADAPWVVFLHGNAANVSTPENVTRYLQLRSLGLQVVAPEYPGFGSVPGRASEAGAAAAARDAWEWVRASGVPASRIAVYGWSLGSGVATHLATTVDERGLVLEGAFTGVDDRAREVYPWLPIRYMIRNPFASRDRIGRIGSPLLLLHARDDRIIPFPHAERLLAAAHGPKRLVALTGGNIRPNLVDQQTYLDGLRGFFAEIFGAPVPTAAVTNPGR
jgi:pimeloyl-ACP methyl ester carboxylesterase